MGMCQVLKNIRRSKVIRDEGKGEDEFIDEKADAGSDETSDDEFIDEEAAAKSLALYCKPVELYSTLRDRFKRQPVFLQRCLSYKIRALRQQRLKVELQVQGLVNMPPFLQWNSCRDYIGLDSRIAPSYPSLPIFVMVTAKPSSPHGIFSLSKVHKVARVPLRDTGALSAPVTFLLPPLAKLLLHAENRHLLLFIAFVDPRDVFDTTKQQVRDLASCSGNVLWSKLSLTSLCMQWLWNANWDSAPPGIPSPCLHAVFTLDFWPGKLQHFDEELVLVIREKPFPREAPISLRRSEMRLQGRICAEEIGESILNETTLNGISQELNSSPRNYRGRVEFHYFYYFNRCEKIEVMERFSCPFCLTKCHTFKCLRCHLRLTHDLFNFEYLLNADIPVVNVTCRTELLDSEGEILHESKPDLKTKLWTFGSHRPCKKTLSVEHSDKSGFPGAAVPVLEKLRCSKKRAAKAVDRKGKKSGYRNALGQSPRKRKKLGATFHEEIQLAQTERPVEVASYLRSGLMRNRPLG